MKLSELVLEGRTEKVNTFPIPGTDDYTVDLVKNFVGADKVEFYADVYTNAHKKKHSERVYVGKMSDVKISDLKAQAISVGKKFVASL